MTKKHSWILSAMLVSSFWQRQQPILPGMGLAWLSVRAVVPQEIRVWP